MSCKLFDECCIETKEAGGYALYMITSLVDMYAFAFAWH